MELLHESKSIRVVDCINHVQFFDNFYDDYSTDKENVSKNNASKNRS